MPKFYITTAIPYVNARPHIGHALEFILTDAITRYHKIIGDETLLLSGGDENSLKNVQAAEKENTSIQEFVDINSKLFEDLAKKLNVDFDVFQKGSDQKHHLSSQRLWNLCKKDIYKEKYKGLYCVGCEAFYIKTELNEKGECFEHPGKSLEEIEEENYFFNLKRYEQKIKNKIDSGEIQIVPEKRKHEIVELLKKGLTNISISRSNKRAKDWGVEVPNDPTQKMYVWFDALNIYQTGIGFNSDEANYEKWWPADLHIIGKGILRFHAIYWIAFLLSAKLQLPKMIFVHEYLTVGGQKMSKTLGNVLDTIPLIEKYGTDAVRYYLLSKVSPFEDSDVSEEKIKQVYNSDLANGLGNLVARIAKLAETANYNQMQSTSKNYEHIISIEEYSEAISDFRLNDAVNFVWKKITELDRFINQEKPWEMAKTNDQRLNAVLAHAVDQIQEIAVLLEPFLPETSQRIEDQFNGPKIVSQKPLFPRI